METWQLYQENKKEENNYIFIAQIVMWNIRYKFKVVP